VNIRRDDGSATGSSLNRKGLPGSIADTGEMGDTTIDSCHSRWVFDTKRLRYRRILKGPGFEKQMTMTDWRPYHEFHLDQSSDSFVVVLSNTGSVRIRSWRHTEAACRVCGVTGSEELPVDDIAHVEGG